MFFSKDQLLILLIFSVIFLICFFSFHSIHYHCFPSLALDLICSPFFQCLRWKFRSLAWEPFYLLVWAFKTINFPLNTSFAAFLKFWCCAFIFIHLECFLLSFVMSYLTHWLSKSVVFLVWHRWVLPDSLQPHGLQHTGLICPLSPAVCSNSCPLTQWCYLTFSSSVVNFPHFLLFLISTFIPLWLENTLCIIQSFEIYWGLFYSIAYGYPGKCAVCAWKECVFCCCWVKCSLDVCQG